MALKFQILNRTNTRKLEPGQRLQEHGITFERLANGDGKWSVNLRIDGQRVHRHLGKESAGVTREQCEQFIEQARTEARQGRLNLPKGRKVTLSFRQAAEKYLEKLTEEGGKDLVRKKISLEQHLVPFFGDTPISRVTTFDVERYKKARSENQSLRGGDRVSQTARQLRNHAGALVKPVSKGTINNELACLSHVLNKAVEWKWLDHLPAKVKRFKLDNGRIDYLTTEQIDQLLQAAREDQSPDIYPFIVIGLETSMRKSEILGIRLEDIQIEQLCIFIPKAKAGGRQQPITQHLAQFLKGYLDQAKAGQQWLFPTHKQTSKTGHMTSIEKPFRRVVESAGLDPKTVVRHTLRHTAITHLVQAGIDLPTVQRISGHKTLSMVVRYAHANGDHIRSALDKLESRYRPSDNRPSDTGAQLKIVKKA